MAALPPSRGEQMAAPETQVAEQPANVAVQPQEAAPAAALAPEALDGEASSAGEKAGTFVQSVVTPTPSPSPTAAPTAGFPRWAWWGVGVLLLSLAFGGIVWHRRRR